MSNLTDYHMTPFTKGEFNFMVIIVFIILVCLGFSIYIYLKYFRW